MGVSERVKKIIQRRGLIQEDLGKKIGLDKSGMSKLLNNKRKVEESLLLKLSEVLGVSSDYLLGRTDDPDQVLSDGANELIGVVDLSEKDALEKIKFYFSYNGKLITDDQAKTIYYLSLGVLKD